MRARAMASICCSPPDMEPAAWSRRSASRGNSSSMRSRSASIPGSFRVMAPRRRLSSTDRSAKVPRPWGTWEIPALATA
jgi:hypothetical protein